MMNKDKQAKASEIMKILNKLKTNELTDFEKVCPTETSFNRIKKDTHDRFDGALEEIKFYL
jgi:hypothetical protein